VIGRGRGAEGDGADRAAHLAGHLDRIAHTAMHNGAAIDATAASAQ
jgi:hypothetical protein